ncbi:ZIP family metal transporter [Romboutsia sp. 1001713B170207_170306_H8]|uniref:ZIP family metal transporter n=1 Tax=Romboutsia sp. 1001713B170207_170306_H8 TaxID=2787112 RepID=UPI001899608D|nr:ZIP family metal transporter [Romboutsia sp. 1001713B170207_170306_H8]
MNVLIGILIPFVGTALGSSCVFIMKKEMNTVVNKVLLGFASGVMIAASVWSLIIPSIDMSSNMGKFSFIPAAVGILVGVLFMLALDSVIPHLHYNYSKPEGMAVGIVFAGILNNGNTISIAAAFALSIGIAIQNFPEGAIISMPLRSEGVTKSKSFYYGLLSGIVEPIGAALTIIFSSFITPAMPYFLSFAAGAMIYVVVEELILEASEGKHSDIGTIGFALGFVLMMILDVALA